MEELLSHIVEEWFLTEPLMFSAWCTHELVENTKMSVPMRTGKMRIEYNPDILEKWPDSDCLYFTLINDISDSFVGGNSTLPPTNPLGSLSTGI